MPEIIKENEYKQIIQPTGKQKVPVVFHVSDELMPDESTIEKLVDVASNEHIFHHTAALADVHHKPGRKNPSGTVVATEKYFLPQLLDTAPNCGMRLIKTPFSENDLSKKQIDDLFKKFVQVVPTKKYFGNYISLKTVLDICQRGSKAVLEHLKKDSSATENMLMNGNMFEDEKISKEDLFTALPPMFYRFGQFRLGILGAAGNHFLDLMKITDIIDESMAQKFGVTKGQYVFLLHTGSGLIGQYASYFYTPKRKEHLSQKMMLELSRMSFLGNKKDWHQTLKNDIPAFKDKNEFYAIDSESDLGKNYYTAHRAAGNFGFANRDFIQFNMEKAIKEILGKDDALDLLYDMSHVYVNKENHFGKDVLVHRSNTSRAFGPSKMQGTKFAETGEPIFMPSSMSTSAYFGVATDENESTFRSAAHGTGRAKEKTSEVPQNKEELFEKMKKRGVKLYNAESKGVVAQDASSYKDPDKALADMEANKIIKTVAKMQPVAVLMY